MSAQSIRSTGRGGAGNIGVDNTQYTDGGVVRKGVQGESIDGDFSTGRGGAGNIGQERVRGGLALTERRSGDFIPDVNQREAHEDFHTGRGGAGNVHKDKHDDHSGPGIGDKIKHVLHLEGSKKP